MDYNDYGYGYDSLGNPIDKSHDAALGKKDINGWGSLILFFGVGIAIYDKGNKWKITIINYFSNIFHHPAQLLHLDTMFFLLLLFFFTMGFLKLLRRRFFN